MKIKHLLLISCAFAALTVSAQSPKKKTAAPAIGIGIGSTPATATATATSLARPKLVVGIVVDQMRWDYLYRFYDRYQNNGFSDCLTRVLAVTIPK